MMSFRKIVCDVVLGTPKTRFSEPRFSELLDLMNKLQLTFFIFYSLSRLDLVNRLNLVNKKGLTITFTKSSLGCTYILYYIPTSIKIILSVQTPNLPLHLILLLPAGQLTFLLLMSFNSVICTPINGLSKASF